MNIYLIIRKEYALSSMSVVSADYGECDDGNALYLKHFRAYRTKSDAYVEKNRLERCGYSGLEVSTFTSRTKRKADARKKETWK